MKAMEEEKEGVIYTPSLLPPPTQLPPPTAETLGTAYTENPTATSMGRADRILVGADLAARVAPPIISTSK